MVQLRDYQEKYILALRREFIQGKKRLVLCAPTGSGKTILFTYMVKNHIKKGGRALVFTHRSELLTQAGGSFDRFGLKPEFITANSAPDLSKPLHIAMVETYNRRRDKYKLFIESKTLIIFDEAHLQNFTKIISECPSNAIVIGATATPFRKPKEIQMADFYDSLVQEIDTKELIEKKMLSPAKSYGVKIDLTGMKRTGGDYDTSEYYEKNETFKGVVKNWEKLSLNTKTVLFANNIKSSKDVCNEFISKGYNAKHIDGKTSKEDRKNLLQWFNDTPNAILCNCGILTAGFDQPDIETVILYRATTSLPLFLQMCGRGSRLSPNKDHFKILDFGNNIQRHGFWEDERTWKLEYKKKSTKERESPIKICKECNAINKVSSKHCVYCFTPFHVSKKEAKEVELKELIDSKIKGLRISQIPLDGLIALQQAKKYKSAFIWRVVRSRGNQTLNEYARRMKYSKGWVYRQKEEIKNGNNNFKDLLVL